MNSLQRGLFATAGIAAMLAGVVGCGLKGPLVLPEKSQNVVIRDKQTGAKEPTQSAPAEPARAGPERLPPPELPRTDSSNPHG
jgi:predicted small lipoprotein YifL